MTASISPSPLPQKVEGGIGSLREFHYMDDDKSARIAAPMKKPPEGGFLYRS